jgi:MATE family, multidrug efflux pump
MWSFLRATRAVRFARGTSLAPDWGIIRTLFRIGLPAAVQGLAMNIAGVLLLRFIGSLERSAEAQAAYAVAYMGLFPLITWTSVGLMGATAVVASQYHGTGHPDRVIHGVHAAARIGLAVAATIATLFWLVPGPLLRIFGLEDPTAVALGTELLRFLSVSAFCMTVALTFVGGLQGTGDTRSPSVIALMSQVVVPLGLCFVFQQTGTLEPAEVWTAIVLGHFTRAILSVVRFHRGTWRRAPRPAGGADETAQSARSS